MSGFVSILLLISIGLPAVAVDEVLVGVYSDEWSAAADLDRWSAAAGVAPTFVGTFQHPLEGPQNTNWILEQAWLAGGTPIVNLEVNQLSYTIAAQHYDEELRLWAIDVLTWIERGDGRSLVIAPMAEANGDWVSWGMDPYNFQTAYRRIVDIFTEVGLDGTQVRWMFAPNSVSIGPWSISDYWPGDDYVDVMGFSAYNFAGPDWISPAEAYGPTVAELSALGPDKPIVVAQTGTGSDGGDKDRWIEEMFSYVAAQPQLVGFVYFNFDKERDWKVWRDGAVALGWTNAIDTTEVAHGQPLTGWFRNGEVEIDPLDPIAEESVPSSVTPRYRGWQFESGRFLDPSGGVVPE